MRRSQRRWCFLLAALFAGCTAAPASFSPAAAPRAFAAPARSAPAFAHIVIAIQENRSFDNVFAGAANQGLMPGRAIDVVKAGYGGSCADPAVVSTCNRIRLRPLGYQSQWDPNHSSAAILGECNAPTPTPPPAAGTSPCLMNGFQGETFSPTPPPISTAIAYSFLPPAQIAPYVQLANAYGIADEFFSASRGPSFPGHVFLISGFGPTDDPAGDPWGCSEPPSVLVPLFTAWGPPKQPQVPPCFSYPTIAQRLDARGVSWKYYTGETPPDGWDGLVEPFAAFAATKTTPHQVPRARFFTDIANAQKKGRCGLPAVSWVTPNGNASDHAGFDNTADGPYWVATLYEAIAQSPCYASTAYLVLWDDSGGWYDHVPPPYVLVPPPAKLLGYRDNVAGFRVPLLFIAPNAVPAVSHTQRDFGAVLAFIEKNFGLRPLGGLDLDFNGDALQDMYAPKPSATITPIPVSQILTRKAPHDLHYFLSQPERAPDNE